MTTDQLALPLAADDDANKPNLLDVGLAYVLTGRLDWGDVVLADASGPPPGWRERIYREARADHRRRRLSVAEMVAGADVPEPAAAAYVKGMWFRWSGPRWRPFLTDENLARIITWLGLPEPHPDVEPF